MASVSKSLQWAFDSGVPTPVAVVPVDFATASPWNISCASSAYDGKQIEAHWVTVDNYANGASVSISFSNLLTFAIAPYTRKTFRMPAVSNSVSISGSTGAINIIFWSQTNQPNPDDANLLAIQSSAAQNVSYPYVDLVTDRAMAAGDQNKRLRFTKATLLTYTLSGILASAIPNGWNSFVQNRGSANVALTPAGADTINAVFNAATPLTLSPNNSGTLSSDGGVWQFEGTQTFEGAEIAIAAAGVSDPIALPWPATIMPTTAMLWMRCKTAELNYIVGDELPVGQLRTNGGANVFDEGLKFAIAGNAGLRMGNSAARGVANYTTGNLVAITLANWRYFVRATKEW